MVLNISNITKTKDEVFEIPNNIEFLNLNIDNYLCGSIIIVIFICLSIIAMLFRSFRVNLNDVKQRNEI